MILPYENKTKHGPFTLCAYQEELERYLEEKMEAMIVTVCLNLQSSYDKIIIGLCDNIEELNKENQFDKMNIVTTYTKWSW